MSIALVKKGGLRWWTQEELARRDAAFNLLRTRITHTLLSVNSAWQFQQCESPMLMPAATISDEYDDSDVFLTSNRLGLRPETTAGSFLYAQHLLESHDTPKFRLPLAVYQIGKSYRVEKSDGASPSKLRYNEFTQAEWQCLYSNTTRVNYQERIIQPLLDLMGMFGLGAWQQPSDRLPSYSKNTVDIMAHSPAGREFEVASISVRTDFPDPDVEVLEIAFGVDRLLDIHAL